MDHEYFLKEAIRLAVGSVEEGGGPYGAVIVRDGEIIASGVNTVEVTHDPSAHAEMAAIREACQVIASSDLSSTVLYASGEPCPMCLAASYQAKIGKIYYACSKQEALEELPVHDKVKNFYSDQNKPGELRDVPFTHMKVSGYLEPFQAAAERKKV